MSNTETTETQIAPVKELHRSRDDRVVAGVAGGLGDYFDLSPTFFRIAFVILTLVGGAGILLYIAAVLVIPEAGRSESIAAEALHRHRDRPWLLVGVALVGIALLSLLATADFWPNSGFAWTLLLLGGLAIVIAQRRGTDGEPVAQPGEQPAPVPRPEKRPSLFLPALGALLASAGVLALLSALGVGIRWDIALAVGAIAIGLVVAVGASLQRRTGGLVVVGLVLALLAVAVSAVDVRLEGPIGDRVYRPFEAVDVNRNYDLSIGDLTVDLSNTSFGDETEVDANVGIGRLTVVVPDDVNVDVDASASAGDVTVFDRTDSGFDADVSTSQNAFGSDKTVLIDAHVGVGEVLVLRESDPRR